MSGFATSEAATASSTMYESRVNMDLPVSKFTPVSTSVGRGGAPGVGDRAASGANRMRQPFASTWLPGGAGGHLPGGVGVAAGGFTASTGSGQPTASTLVPAGVLGHWSMPSGTPSRSLSNGQPLASTVACRTESTNVPTQDRKSTRLNSSHGYISYAVFCLKKKTKNRQAIQTTCSITIAKSRARYY